MSESSGWSSAAVPMNTEGKSNETVPVFIASEQGFGKTGYFKVYVTRSGLFGGKLANQDPKMARAATMHFGIAGWIIGGMMAKKAAKQMAEREAIYDAMTPDDSRFLGVDPGNFWMMPENIGAIEIKSKLGVAGWGSDYDCSFQVQTTDGKKRTFFVKKGVGAPALENTLRALTQNITVK